MVGEVPWEDLSKQDDEDGVAAAGEDAQFEYNLIY